MKSKRHSLIERLENRQLLTAVEGIDTSFGANGRADVPADVLVAPLPSGEYLVVGSNRQNDEGSAAPNVSLLTTNGALDTTFGNGGQTIVPQIGFGAKAVLAGNQVLIASNVDDGLVDVFALKMDGTINESFAPHSFVDIPAPPLVKGDVFDSMTVDSIAAQSDGSAIVAFRATEAPKGGGTTTVLTEMVRVTSKGKFDTDFGTNGFVQIASHVDSVNATLSSPNFAIDNEDRIVVTTELSGERSSGQVDRFNADGKLDTKFGDKGVLTNQTLATDAGLATTMAIFSLTEAIQADDKILIGGTVDQNQAAEPAVISRLNPDGSLDTTFGMNGAVQLNSPTGGTETIGPITTDSQGRIIVPDDSTIRRLTSDGAADKKFSTNGVMDFVDAVTAAGFNATNAGVTDAENRIIVGDQDSVIRFSPQQPAVLGKKGTLHITGSDGGDIFGISARDGVLRVNVNGAVLKFTLADVVAIDMELGGGNNKAFEYVNLPSVVNANGNGAGTDSILTGGGDDAITASGQEVTIDSGAGDDHIHAGEGDFTIHGGAGNDWIVAPAASSAVIYGDDGNDSIFGSPGNDSIYGDAGKDTIHGGFGNDLIDGNGGNDHLFGQAGNNHLQGDDGDDSIIAGDGSDTIDGGNGTDTAIVNFGADETRNVEHVLG